ncbi:tRNA (guanosine(46)-N7)-methyltransferase TrmB [Ligilactobacillus araffinosus]|uniref:tRNA (guanine-N(7)-)-methyltransferase n=1 Tax=Ligilactobacillus araffinosus DSM 20653 TaxID=1423820 RepID=A0A0R1ZGA3_9LACO|nr:tRNA (guanosine(46)-N7)-methyltransferase TrmB [Ligilactobacillus araffinosus]KRM53343.1 tRNA (m(7)G46) methyltransferase [Ligilactobacillus araffinosus DSM 20653]
MRLRNRPWAKPLIEENPQYVVTEPQQFKGKWQTRFEKPAPLFVEVGMGKGQFIVEMAARHPENNYIGMELQTVATGMALKKQLERKLTNLQLVRADGSGLTEYFEEDEVDGIYLNFSDPWPKKRQAKRRLTYPTFLKQYQIVMKNSGNIEFKTDNRGLFEYSLTSMNNFGMRFDQVWLDLHQSEDLEDNVMTEYEEKFSKKGPIYKLKAHFQREEENK